MTIPSRSHALQSFRLRNLDPGGTLSIFEKERDCKTLLGLKGSRLLSCHIFGLTLLSGWFCGHP